MIKNKKIYYITSFLIISIIISGIFFLYNISLTDDIRQHSLESAVEVSIWSAQAFRVSFEEKINNAKEAAVFFGEHTSEEGKKILLAYEMATGMNLSILHSNGMVYHKDGTYEQLQQKEFYQQIKEKKEGMTTSWYNNTLENEVISSFATYQSKDGEINKILVHFELDDFKEYFNTVNNGSSNAFIIDENGNTIISPDFMEEEKRLTNVFHLAENQDQSLINSIKRAMKSDTIENLSIRYGKQHLIVTFVPLLENIDWNLITITSESILLKKANSIIIKNIVASVSTLLAFLFIIIVINQKSRKIEREKMELQTIDSITGRINFSTFKDRMKEILQRNPEKEYAIGSLDIKKFKLINEAYGFEEGDKILQKISDILNENKEDSVPIFARTSADNFVLLVSTAQREKLKKIYRYFCDLECWKEYDIKFYLGIYCIPSKNRSDSINAMLDYADLAKKKAKEKDMYECNFYEEEMRIEELEMHKLESEMESALENGEFQVYLQPKFTSDTNHCVASEALIRWIHPLDGIISPSKFIPLFEKNKFIIKIDRYVFETCCKLIRKWLDTGKKAVSVSVNVSKVQIYLTDFLDFYVALKEKYRIPDQLIELEFTESIFFENIEYLSDLITRLEKAGFSCSIDDFGKGYSSFGSLKDLPFDILKIDSAFFQNSMNQEREKVIVSCIVNMSKALSMRTVAEGVETEELVEYLRSINCDLIQGFYFSKPLPIQEFEEKYIIDQCAVVKEEKLPYIESFNLTEPKKLIRRDICDDDIVDQMDKLIRKLELEEETNWIIAKHTGIIVLEWDLEKDAFYYNEEIKNYIIGSNIEEQILENRDFILFLNPKGIHPNDYSVYEKFRDQLKAGSNREEIIIRITKTTNQCVWCKIACTYITNQEKKRCRAIATMHRIFDQEYLGKEQRMQVERYRILAESTNIITFEYDIEREIMKYELRNKQGELEEIILEDYMEYIPKSIVIHDDHKNEYKQVLMEAIQYKSEKRLDYMADYYGTGFRWVRAYFVSVADARDKVFCVVGKVVDINDDKEELNAIKKKAELDLLTNVLNKGSYIEKVKVELSKNTTNMTQALCMFDIDDFKNINDTYGHTEGDNQLELLANVLQKIFRKEAYVGRFGGDEFTVFLKHTNREEVKKKVKMFYEDLKKEQVNKEFAMCCSTGIAIINHPVEFEQLLDQADKAMYQAKNNGKNQFTIFENDNAL